MRRRHRPRPSHPPLFIRRIATHQTTPHQPVISTGGAAEAERPLYSARSTTTTPGNTKPHPTNPSSRPEAQPQRRDPYIPPKRHHHSRQHQTPSHQPVISTGGAAAAERPLHSAEAPPPLQTTPNPHPTNPSSRPEAAGRSGETPVFRPGYTSGAPKTPTPQPIGAPQ